jgi:hypothetical protein
MDATCFDILDNFLSHPFPKGVIDFADGGVDPLLLGGQLAGQRHALSEILSFLCKFFFLSKNIVIACEWKCHNLIMYEP